MVSGYKIFYPVSGLP